MSDVHKSRRAQTRAAPVYLPMNAWPASDRAAWNDLFAPGDMFDDAGAARHWAPATRRTNAHHYARWLGWLRGEGQLDVTALPSERVTPAAVEAYARHLIEQIAPFTVASSLVGLKVVMKAMRPDMSWRWLMDVTNRLHVWAKPAVDRRAAIQPIGDIYATACDELDRRLATPLTRRTDRVACRDALAVALLAACPVRLRNLAMIRIGVHLVVEDTGYVLQFNETETKNGQRLAFLVPASLAPYIRAHHDRVRPTFSPREQTDALWLGFEGQPLTAHSLYGRIVAMTQRVRSSYQPTPLSHLCGDQPDGGHARQSALSGPAARSPPVRDDGTLLSASRSDRSWTEGRRSAEQFAGRSKGVASVMKSAMPLRAVVYARYSSELQNQASVEDQTRLCRRRIDAESWQLTHVYADRGMSGASHLRPGYQKLMEDARSGLFDVVVAKSIDRLSRDQEHIASLFKLLNFRRIPLITIAEGEISELHVGLKGTMSALYLKDLAQKTHRGLEGRVRQGRSAGGISFGYDVVRTFDARGAPVAGERAINEAEAAVVRRIFTDFASGKSPRAIAGALNKEGIGGPQDNTWGASTIYGNWRRSTGILNNELYVGRLIWNRQRFVKDPATGRRQAVPNPPEEWVTEEVPALRIVDDALWSAVKERQVITRQVLIKDDGAVRAVQARRPRFLFSGLIRCGACGGGYTLVGRRHYGCANVRNKGTCRNRLTIRRDILEETVLSGLRDKLLDPALIAEFVGEYQAEWNRLRREEEILRSRDRVELAKVEKQIANMIEAIKQGFFAATMKAEMEALEARKLGLARDDIAAEPDLPRLHPGLAGVYRRKVEELTAVLNVDALRDAATETLRSLIGEIRLVPEGDTLAIELVGELAGILALSDAKSSNASSPRIGFAGARQLTLVAGAGLIQARTEGGLRLQV